MVVLILGVISGIGIYYEILDNRTPQVSAVTADMYAHEGILHLEMEQNGGSVHDSFVLIIQINQKEYNGEVIVDGAAQNIKNGKLKLKGGQKADICSIPFGSEYHILEKENICYTTRTNGENTMGVSGIIDEEQAESSVVFSNTWGTGSLSLKNTHEGGSEDSLYEFTVKMNGELYHGFAKIKEQVSEEGTAADDYETQISERNTSIHEEPEYSSDDFHEETTEREVVNGVICLKGNETAVFEKLSFGTTYEITMKGKPGYKTMVDRLETCTDSGIVSGQNRSPVVIFENIVRNETESAGWGMGELPGQAAEDKEKTERTNKTVKLMEPDFNGMIFLEVKDQKGNPLEGARYQLFMKKSAEGKIAECWEAYEEDKENGIYTTNSAGVLVVTNLSENDYYFAELKDTEEYDLSGIKYIFSVKNDRK